MIPDRGQPSRGRFRTGTPPEEPPAVAGLGPVTRLVLPNGLTVLVRENRGVPVVALTLLSRAGAATRRRSRTA